MRARFAAYPNFSPEAVDRHVARLLERDDRKAQLIGEQGLTNAQAEAALDREGFPRPPSWHSVFFYPDSWRPRNRTAALAAAALAVAALLL